MVNVRSSSYLEKISWTNIIGEMVSEYERYRNVHGTQCPFSAFVHFNHARRAGSDGSMSASGSAGLGFDPQQGSKFSYKNFQPRG